MSTMTMPVDNFIAPPPPSGLRGTPMTLDYFLEDRGMSAPACQACQSGGTYLPSGQWRSVQPGEVTLGTISWLPRKVEMGSSSCAHSYLNEWAYNHPCVIISSSTCRHMVFCLQVTSFGGRTIHEKYRSATDHYKTRFFNEYIALRRQDTRPHNTLGELDYSGQEMRLQSYVHLEYGFWIECNNLTTKKVKNQLDFPSLGNLRRLYMESEAYRQQHGSVSIGRLGSSPPPFPPPSRSSSVDSGISAASTTTSKRTGSPDSISSGLSSVPSQGSSHMSAGASAPPTTLEWRRGASAPAPSGWSIPDFILPRLGNAAVKIVAPTEKSTPEEKRNKMQGNWR